MLWNSLMEFWLFPLCAKTCGWHHIPKKSGALEKNLHINRYINNQYNLRNHFHDKGGGALTGWLAELGLDEIKTYGMRLNLHTVKRPNSAARQLVPARSRHKYQHTPRRLVGFSEQRSRTEKVFNWCFRCPGELLHDTWHTDHEWLLDQLQVSWPRQTFCSYLGSKRWGPGESFIFEHKHFSYAPWCLGSFLSYALCFPTRRDVPLI